MWCIVSSSVGIMKYDPLARGIMKYNPLARRVICSKTSGCLHYALLIIVMKHSTKTLFRSDFVENTYFVEKHLFRGRGIADSCRDRSIIILSASLATMWAGSIIAISAVHTASGLTCELMHDLLPTATVSL